MAKLLELLMHLRYPITIMIITLQIINVNCTRNSDALGVAVITTTILHVLRLVGRNYGYITSAINISSQFMSVLTSVVGHHKVIQAILSAMK